MDVKVCTKCGLEKSVDAFYRKLNQCKACNKAVNLLWRAATKEVRAEKKRAAVKADPEKAAADQKRWRAMRSTAPFKTCKRCGVEKPQEDFHLGANPCKACASEIARERYAKDPSAKLIASKRWHAEHPEVGRESVRLWMRKQRLLHPEDMRAKKTKWRKENPDKERASKHRRRAVLASVENTLTDDDVKELLRQAAGHCHYCRKRRKLTLDHVVPVVKLGANAKHNCVMACLSCNSGKCDADVRVFLARMKKVWIAEGNTEALAMMDGTAKSPCMNVHCSHLKRAA